MDEKLSRNLIKPVYKIGERSSLLIMSTYSDTRNQTKLTQLKVTYLTIKSKNFNFENVNTL